ncbi:MAG: hypothetical protein ACJ8F7_12905 [Gemmataceae bacterium]
MVTVGQYREAVRANRRWEYCILAALLYMFAVGVVSAWLLRSFGDAWMNACVRWIVQHDPSRREIWLAVAAVFLPIGLLAAAPAVALLRLRDRGKRRDRRLVCPHCDAFLNNLAALTGNCSRCGEHVLDGSTPAASDGYQLFTVTEFNSAVHNRQTLRDPKGLDPRLRCPCCQLELTRNRAFVVATRKCPSCQTVVLEEPEASFPADASRSAPCRLSLAEFRAAHWSHIRWTLTAILTLIPCAGLLYCLLIAGLEEPLTRLMGSAGFGAVALTAFLLGLGLASWVADRTGRFLRRKRCLNCPLCGKSLIHPGGIVIATRRCYHCGGVALADDAPVLSSLTRGPVP